MERKVLAGSPVVFNEEHHTYTLYGQELSGVTPIISWLFPDTYKGIPESVLANAAEYGSAVHKACEELDSLGMVNDEHKDVVEAYQRIMQKAGLTPWVSEYLVSDEKNVASCIDKVVIDDGEYSLCDIKTTSKVHGLNVQIQLSIYAYLFELQNPEQKIKNLYCIWLPKEQYGVPQVIQLRRICSEWCKIAIERYIMQAEPLDSIAELAAMGFTPEVIKQRVAGDVPEEMEALVNELITVKKQLDIYTEREKEIKAQLLDAMQQAGEDKWSNDLINISKRAASQQIRIDNDKLKKQFPEVFVEVQKVVNVKESLTYKVL